MTTPTPEQLEEYGSKSEELLSKILELQNSSDWKEAKKDDDVIIYTRSDSSSHYNQVKAVSIIPAPIDKIVDHLKVLEPIDSKTPKEKRHLIKERKILYGPLEDKYQSTIFMYEFEIPAPLVSPRDYVLFRRYYEPSPSQHVFLHNSIVSDLCPERNGAVRGEITFQCYIVEPDPSNQENARLTFLIHSDPKGKMSPSFYNMALPNQGYAASRIKKEVLGETAK